MDRNIGRGGGDGNIILVATREGGVDRNNIDAVFCALNAGSPPARVAWIETAQVGKPEPVHVVATREGGVDRNTHAARKTAVEVGRHPRGWRG